MKKRLNIRLKRASNFYRFTAPFFILSHITTTMITITNESTSTTPTPTPTPTDDMAVLAVSVSKPLLERIKEAYRLDKAFVSMQDVDFSTWIVECLMDWAVVVESEANEN